MQPQAFGCEMLADDGHVEVGALFATVLAGHRVPVVTSLVSQAFGFVQQKLPVIIRKATAFPVGARILASMVEEADVVIGVFERLDRALDELVQLIEIGLQIRRNVKVHHARSPPDSGC